jgi:hypothetical protein
VKLSIDPRRVFVIFDRQKLQLILARVVAAVTFTRLEMSEVVLVSSKSADWLSRTDSASSGEATSVEAPFYWLSKDTSSFSVEASLCCVEISGASFEAIDSKSEENTGIMGQATNLIRTMH